MKNRIKELRVEKNYTQEALAAVVGVNQTSLSRIECGISVPDADLLVQLSHTFQVTTDYLLCLTDQRLTPNHTEHAMKYLQRYQTHISLLQKLNPTQRAHLQHFLESIAAVY